jgi:hypothetical protein
MFVIGAIGGLVGYLLAGPFGAIACLILGCFIGAIGAAILPEPPKGSG